MSAGHLLIVPRAHRVDYFDLLDSEIEDINSLLRAMREKLLREDDSITGFNIGANCGADAGQTVFHCHVHLIPRRRGDDPSPRGGVRAVIPGKKSY